jgi:ABC-type nitrate/sulfonate/bicarbonate transport system substrate-binding protein
MVAVAMVLPACGGDDELTPVTIALTNQRAIQYSPYYIADYVGYFEDEGLDVEIVIVSGSSATVQQIVAGNVDIGHPSGPAVAQGVSQGNCLKQFYSDGYANVFGLASPESTGIQSLADLRGTTVGISEPGGGEVPLVRAILAGAGLSEGTDYELLAIGEGGALTFEALSNGTAQAYSSSVFDVAAIEAAGIPLRQLMPDEFRYFPSTNMVVTCDYFDENSDTLVKFARAVAKAQLWRDTNQQGAKDITKFYEPELWEDAAIAEAFWAATIELNTPPPALAGSPNGTNYRAGWDLYLQFASQGTEEEGALNADAVNLDELLTDELLSDINDFDRDDVISDAQDFEGVSS